MLCRPCKKADESIDHPISGCGKLPQKEYKRRYDNFGKSTLETYKKVQF